MPEVTENRPLIRLNSVVLPAPLGPIDGMALAMWNVEIDAADDLGAAEALAARRAGKWRLLTAITPLAFASAIRASQRGAEPARLEAQPQTTADQGGRAAAAREGGCGIDRHGVRS